MCDQTEVIYRDGDVVWVKIGPIWWPGVVKDVEKEGKEKEVLGGLKTKPIATVQFFEEDKYEFVKNLENIYHYNCRRKDEFIKKGLDKYRKGAKHMMKFPEDVGKAEQLVHGDSNIINDPKYAPEKKTDYSEIFGTPKKKTKKTHETQLKTKFLPLKKRHSAPVHIRQVSKGRNLLEKPLTQSGDLHYCPFCNFSSRLVTNITTHTFYMHSSRRVDFAPAGYNTSSPLGAYTEPRRAHTIRPGGKKKGRLTKSKESSVDKTPTGKSMDETPVKRSIPVVTSSEKSLEKKKRFTDALLADWSEDDDSGKEDVGDKNMLNESENSQESESKEEIKQTGSALDVTTTSSVDVNGDKKETASCFDFDEDDDGFIGMSDANTYGRKIPRVIPAKDKTDLGMDLEIEDLFKRKPEAEEDGEGGMESEPPKKKRGRRPAALTQQMSSSVPVKPRETLAMTRERRPGARKSYLNEVIEKIDDIGVVIPKNENSTPQEPPKPSRRKQDLKRQSLKELDDIEPLTEAKLEESTAKMLEKRKKDQDLKKSIDEVKKKIVGSNEEDDNLTAQVESLLAETSTPVLAPVSGGVGGTSKDEELLEATVEYLEDEPEPVNSSPNDSNLRASPVKKWKEDIRLALEGDAKASVKKSVIPLWRQGIQEALKTHGQTSQPLKDIIVEGKPNAPEQTTAKVVQISQFTKPKLVKQKDGTFYLLKQQTRPKILGNPHLMLVSNQRSGNLQLVSTSKSSPIKTTTQPVVQYIADGKGPVKKVAVTKKFIHIGNKNSPKYILSGKGRDNYRIIENYNGTGKRVVIKEVPSVGGVGQRVFGVRNKVQTVPIAGGSTQPPQTQCVLQRIKCSDGKYTTKIIKGSAAPQKRQPPMIIKSQEPVKVVMPEPQPVIDTAVEQPAVRLMSSQTPALSAQQQVVAMPVGSDGQTTYVLVSVDESGMLQTVDGSMLPFGVQQDVAAQLYATPPDDMAPVYSTAGQDILAEALANTNVLESEMPLMNHSVVDEGSVTVTLHKPILAPLDIPSNPMPDASNLLIAPVVQETSVTLQKPIMTPVEVPTSIVHDTSGLEPPPLPPTPTEEDVLMEESEGGLMIAEQQVEEQEQEPGDQRQASQTAQGDFYIDDSQEGEQVNSFQSMPLLNEESTALEEPIEDQHFEVQGSQIENSEYLPTSTNPDLEPEANDDGGEENLLVYPSGDSTLLDAKESKDSAAQGSMPLINEDGEPHRSQETEVSSTTGDSKDTPV